jgi:hypothetical protein
MSRLIARASVAVLLVAAMCAAQSPTTAEPNLQELIGCSAKSDCASSTCCVTGLVCVNRQFAPTSEQCASFPCGAITRDPNEPVYECSCSSSGTCESVAVGGTPAPGGPANSPVATSSPIPNPFEILLCSADADCKSASCCTATGCVNKGFAPDCADVTSSICPTFSVACACDSNSRCALRGNTGSPNAPNSPNGSTTSAPGANSDLNLSSATSLTLWITLTLLTAVAAGCAAALL